MSRIAFVTYTERPDITTDDELAAGTLRRRGHEVHPLCWDGQKDQEIGFDLVVLRSPWNYHLLPLDFLAWLHGAATKAKVVNAPEIVRWNAHKRYLIELAAVLPVVPTVLVSKGEPADVSQFSQRLGTESVVVKPAISASAYLTASFTTGQLAEAQSFLERLTVERDALVQPFVEAIATHGEVSVMFFGDKFSHAVIKHPKAGEFRVQHELGGSIAAYTPDNALLSLCETALANVPGGEKAVYARIDVVNDPAIGWQLQELELIEPSLYFEYSAAGAERFADAIEQTL